MFEGILATSWFCGESVAKTCLIRFLVVKMLNMFLIKNSGNIRKNGFPNVTLRKFFQKLLEFFPLSLQQIPRILFKMASQHKIHFFNKIPGIFVRSYSLQEKNYQDLFKNDVSMSVCILPCNCQPQCSIAN